MARTRTGVRRAAPQCLRALGACCLAGVLLSGCEKDREMAERLEMPDTMMVMEAMHDEEMQDSILDVMPGGEMARGDSAASERLMRAKLEPAREDRMP